MAEKQTSAAEEFIAARDFLLRHREDCDIACRDFRWPQAERFNWALDYFDHMAEGNGRPALWIVNEDGTAFKASFAEMRVRANRAANFLRALGVKRGDRILLMLGNVPPLWEVMLAAMKLGAVLIPSTTLLNREDLLDRLTRGRVTQVIAASEETSKFADLPGSFTVPKAFVVLAAGAPATRETAAAIFAHVREHLAPFKRVRRLEFAELPKTISGKIRRVELRRIEDERRGAGRHDPQARFGKEFWIEDFASSE
jgi:acyl-coenzyme A synthetase/AMP-(fatty) acid ligase